MSDPQARTLYFRCSKCNEEFLPYGDRLMIPPATDYVVCPKCGQRDLAIWSVELQKEIGRKELGLTIQSDSKSTLNAITTTELKYEISSIKAKIEDLTEQVSDLKNTVEAVIPEIKVFITDVITEILVEQNKSKNQSSNIV